ncbi:MAG: IMP dehydrogenase [Planctomycetaceae bacterium]|nr:IMP dehydrogenase [Planctomycetaceae bacterium]
MQDRIINQGLTFDDVLLVPAYSEVMPADVDVSSQLTRNIRLNVPIISSPMDTVTEAEMAIGMAQEGGIGIVHKNMSIDAQALQVERVKRAEHGVIVDPVTLPPEASVRDAIRIMDERNIGGVPIISSPMDTVTEAEMAIGMAQEGGIGIVHKNMSIDAQALQVERVKRAEHGVIVDPVTLPPEASVRDAIRIMDERNIGGVPITQNGKLKGIITRRDLRFLDSKDIPVEQVMTRDNLITAHEHTRLKDAERILRENKVEKLLLVDDQYQLKGLITIKDIDKNLRFPRASKDNRGRLRVGAAVGVFDLERAGRLIESGVDVLVVDSAHGHSKNVIETVRQIKRQWSIDVIAGNVATGAGARDLLEAGADTVKVGIGPGSICTTRIISGVGVPQLTAISSVAEALAGSDVPLIADGGIRYSGDITKALATGAHVVMLGGLLAGLDESPGEMILYQGRTFKRYRGMGSLGAMVQGSSERYRQSVDGDEAKGKPKLVPEGVEGRVAYKGPLHSLLYQLVGGLRAGMGYLGVRTIDELRTKPQFLRVSAATVRENHPHDIAITQESPNYSVEHAPSDAHL